MNNYNGGQGSYCGNNLGYKYALKLTRRDRRQYFCDHYKIADHTIQRCYKIYGYPPRHRLYKGKRMATKVHNDQARYNSTQDVSSSQTSSSSPALTPEQYS